MSYFPSAFRMSPSTISTLSIFAAFRFFAAMREKLGMSLSPAEHDELDRIIDRARGELPAVEQDQAWSDGRLMSVDRLLECALDG